MSEGKYRTCKPVHASGCGTAPYLYQCGQGRKAYNKSQVSTVLHAPFPQCSTAFLPDPYPACKGLCPPVLTSSSELHSLLQNSFFCCTFLTRTGERESCSESSNLLHQPHPPSDQYVVGTHHLTQLCSGQQEPTPVPETSCRLEEVGIPQTLSQSRNS